VIAAKLGGTGRRCASRLCLPGHSARVRDARIRTRCPSICDPSSGHAPAIRSPSRSRQDASPSFCRWSRSSSARGRRPANPRTTRLQLALRRRPVPGTGASTVTAAPPHPNPGPVAAALGRSKRNRTGLFRTAGDIRSGSSNASSRPSGEVSISGGNWPPAVSQTRWRSLTLRPRSHRDPATGPQRSERKSVSPLSPTNGGGGL